MRFFKSFFNTKKTIYFKAIGFIVCILCTVSGYGLSDKLRKEIVNCDSCHGLNGNSTSPEVPSLAGQSKDYLIKQLKEIKNIGNPTVPVESQRQVPVMQNMLDIFTESELIELADHYTKQPTIKRAAKDDESLKLGQQIYRGGSIKSQPTRPPCSGCHGIDGLGTGLAPRLQNLSAAYIIDQLKQFKMKTRTNDVTTAMYSLASQLTDQQIEAVANYIQGLPGPNQISYDLENRTLQDTSTTNNNKIILQTEQGVQK